MPNNLKQHYPLFIFLLIAAAGLVALPHRAFAAQKSTGSSDPSQLKPLIIPTDMALSWKGRYTIEGASVMRRAKRGIPGTISLAITGSSIGKTQRNQVFSFRPSAVYSWIASNTAAYNVTPQEPKITIYGNRVTEFEPPRDGRIVDAYASMEQALVNLERGNYTVTPIVNVSQPRDTLSELNDLGINELLSRGESTFSNSPSNRRHNIKVGVKKFTGVIIKPGEEFSFNKYLGPVEAFAGFLPELVIRADKGTVPELGGGLCQVSSTTFRAAIHAGLPITQRRNHSYAVQYYAPQGTDATIYPGVIDLKFTNDTPGSILVWPYLPDNDTLVFDFYGTRDDRKVTLKDPVQFDRRSDGSLKASWTRTVTKNGESDTVTFNSNYKSPALFHKKEEFVKNPGSEISPGIPAPGTTPTSPTTPNGIAPPSANTPLPITQ